jgi:hypothetical protein
VNRSLHKSHDSHPSLLPQAEVIYDITFRFAHKFLAHGDRTIDQMSQAALSGDLLHHRRSNFPQKSLSRERLLNKSVSLDGCQAPVELMKSAG